MRQRGPQLWLKLTVDRIAGAVAFVLLLPVMAAVAAAIRLTMGRPVFFRQERPGFKNRLFVIYKFRTMNDARATDGQLLPDAQRLTRVGRFVRAASLDELPQLWNVLKGELSLVGPRPLLVQYLERYSPEQRARHEVRPGITGWAQVNGRNAISWSDKFKLDLWYVENWSFLLDLRIMALTVAHLFKAKDTVHPGHVSMPEFMGDDSSAVEGSSPCGAERQEDAAHRHTAPRPVRR